MKEKILFKEEIPKLYKELSQNYRFYGPIKEKGYIRFREIDDPELIELEFFNSKVPPKEILFPEMETLFKYEKTKDSIKIIENEEPLEEKIIFGIRPCDAHSFNLLENFFKFGEYKDNIFLKKKKNIILIGIGCNSPRSTCFCTSLEGNPFNKDDLDIFLVDLEDRYLLNPVSSKGEKITEKLSWLHNAKEEDIQTALELKNKAELEIKTHLNFENTSKILEKYFDHPLWKKISETCIGCGSCSFFCPTCHCFDVIDENDHYNNRGRRIRIWDTCQFSLYTLHTSGHNPRPNEIERCRNRIMHKFCYYPQNYNLIGCVGCGRCIQLCPVNNDLRNIIKSINKIDQETEEKEEMIVA